MIRLRPYKDSDAPALIKWNSDERVMAKCFVDHLRYPLTPEQCGAYREKHEKEERSWLLTALDEEYRTVGHLMVCLIPEENRIHLGHVMVDPALRGHGLGKEMMRAALKYAFFVMGAERVTLSVFEDNEPARRCYLSAGFRERGYEPARFTYKEEKWGVYFMEIPRKDFLDHEYGADFGL